MAHGTRLLCGMWDLPRPGLEPVSPALAGGFLTTEPPGKPYLRNFDVPFGDYLGGLGPDKTGRYFSILYSL